MFVRHACPLAVLFSLLLVAGCGESEGTTSVTGQVTYKGAPLPMGVINFFPASGARPIGHPLASDGKYEAKLPAGDYTVVVLTSNPPVPPGWKEGDPVPKPPVQIPPKYGHAKNTPLKITVPEGRSFAQDFKLE
jgi:hypothetical protein